MSFDFIDRKFVQKPKLVPDTSKLWWCDACNDHVYSVHVTFQERHDVCGGEVDPWCDECENAGIVCCGIGHNDPHFRECETCHNPHGYRSP
jgi:hypothetical protein